MNSGQIHDIDTVYIITVGHWLFSVQSVDMAAQRLFFADIMADQLLASMWKSYRILVLLGDIAVTQSV